MKNSIDSNEAGNSASTSISGGLRNWLSGVIPGISSAGEVIEPAVTRAEIAKYFAQQLAPSIIQLHAKLGRPGVFALRCRFEGFYEDLRIGLSSALSELSPVEVRASWPENSEERKIAAREAVDFLNAGCTLVCVIPHERVLKGAVPTIDGFLKIARFNTTTLAQACKEFYDLKEEPIVPNEAWVAQVAPADLLINSAVKGDPIPHIRAAVRQRLSEHICTDSMPLESLIGLNTVRDWAEALIDDICDALNPDIRCQWSQIERAVVFSGPCGAGKTSLSRAIARATGLNWCRVSVRRWVAALESERWEPTTERRAAFIAMEDDFDAARVLAPAVLFIEDMEHLPDELAPMLGQLIGQITPSGDDPLFIIGATSDDEKPYASVLTTANFERTVYLPLPTSSLLASVLKQQLVEVTHSLTEEEIAQVGRLALGGTAADIQLYLRRAQKTARREGGRPLKFDDLATAILETPSIGARPKINEQELVATAYHEAGHAVMHFLDVNNGNEIQYASVVPRVYGGDKSLGFVMRMSDENCYSLSKSEALAKIRMMLGGRAAEEILLGAEHMTTGSGGSDSSDLALATRLGAKLIGRCGFNAKGSLVYRDVSFENSPDLLKEVESLLSDQYQQTVTSLKNNWHLVQALAKQLINSQELPGHEVRRFLSEASIS